MDNNDFSFTPDENSFSLDSILAEFEAERDIGGEYVSKRPAEQSHHIIYDSRDQAIGEAELSSETYSDNSAFPDSDFRQDTSAPEQKEPVFRQVGVPEPEPFANPFSAEAPAAEMPSAEPQEEILDSAADSRQEISVDELISQQEIIEDSETEYASDDDYEPEEIKERPSRQPDFKERVLGPIIGLMAAAAIRREEKSRVLREKQAAVPRELPPELRPDRAAGFYAQQASSVKTRAIAASFFTIVLVYLSFGLPALGVLGRSPGIKALVCLILELVVTLIGLDIFTNGLLSLFRKKPGAQSLIAVSCIITALDAAIIAATGNIAVGLPFCAISALSVTLALWGDYLSCKAFTLSFGTAAATENPSVMLSLSGVDDEGSVLAKAKRPVTGFVRTAETADIFENAYRIIAPVLLAGALILSLFCFFGSKKCDDFFHTFAATAASCASLSAIFGFAFPFSVLAKRLAKSGVAVAGYSGAAELGRVRRILVTDTDIFPVRTLSIVDISISEGASPDTVISCTGSIIAAAGMGLAPVFMELIRKNGYTMQRVEDFACHEGGGLVSRVSGNLVYVGSSSFMQLMGIRLPKGAGSKSAVYTAINDELTGIFSIGYKPVVSVQRALVSLFRGKTEPLFAIRDFNITPLLVRQKFRLPSGNYDFPSFADRYRISSPEIEDGGTVVAMFARGGLNSAAGLAQRGRKLYNSLRISLALSLLGTILGMVFMLALCWTGAYDSASCANLMTFMLLWLAPVFIISLGLRY